MWLQGNYEISGKSLENFVSQTISEKMLGISWDQILSLNRFRSNPLLAGPWDPIQHNPGAGTNFRPYQSRTRPRPHRGALNNCFVLKRMILLMVIYFTMNGMNLASITRKIRCCSRSDPLPAQSTNSRDALSGSCKAGRAIDASVHYILNQISFLCCILDAPEQRTKKRRRE